MKLTSQTKMMILLTFYMLSYISTDPLIVKFPKIWITLDYTKDNILMAHFKYNFHYIIVDEYSEYTIEIGLYNEGRIGTLQLEKTKNDAFSEIFNQIDGKKYALHKKKQLVKTKVYGFFKPTNPTNPTNPIKHDFVEFSFKDGTYHMEFSEQVTTIQFLNYSFVVNSVQLSSSDVTSSNMMIALLKVYLGQYGMSLLVVNNLGPCQLDVSGSDYMLGKYRYAISDELKDLFLASDYCKILKSETVKPPSVNPSIEDLKQKRKHLYKKLK
jgi:hypothetical protein